MVTARELLAAGRAAEALAAAERALAAAPGHPFAELARGLAIEALHAGDPILAALELSAVGRAQDLQAQLDLAYAYVELDRPADAERYFRRALALEPRHAAARRALAEMLERRGAVHQAAADPPGAAYGRESLFLEPAPDSRMTVLVLATRSAGNIPYRHLMPSGLYTRLIWYMEHAREAQIASLPRYDLVFNSIGDPDLTDPSATMLRRFLKRCRRPVLNDPARVAQTTRSLTPALLGDLDDVVVPPTARLEHAATLGLRDAVENAGFSLPVLLRPAGSHRGRGLALAETWAEAATHAAALGAQDLYLTAYRDCRSADGRFRQGRAIFVAGRPYPYHWAVGDQWRVRCDTSGTAGEPARQAEERHFLADPKGFVGARAWAAIARIGERLGLDYCGLDFSLLPDGRVLVFEADATMPTHLEDATSPLAYRNPAVQRIIAAFQTRLAAMASA